MASCGSDLKFWVEEPAETSMTHKVMMYIDSKPLTRFHGASDSRKLSALQSFLGKREQFILILWIGIEPVRGAVTFEAGLESVAEVLYR